MVFTSTFTCDAVGDPEPIVVPGRAYYDPSVQDLTLREQNAGITAGFSIRAPNIDSTAVQYQPGEAVTFRGEFLAGSTIGYISAASGSLTMSLKGTGN